MKKSISKNKWLLNNNNNEIGCDPKMDDSLHRKQEEQNSLNEERLGLKIKIDEAAAAAAASSSSSNELTRKEWTTKIRQNHKHSYVVSIDRIQRENLYQSEKSIITDVGTEFIHSKENLLNNQGFIHVKEYSLDAYQCRCDENKDLLTNETISNNKNYQFDYKFEF